MPKPEAEQIAIVRIDGDDLDWCRNLDALTDGELAQWAADRIAAADFTEDTVREAEVVIRWTTNQFASRAASTRSDTLPPYDEETDAEDNEDAGMLERGDRITNLMQEKLRGLLT